MTVGRERLRRRRPAPIYVHCRVRALVHKLAVHFDVLVDRQRLSPDVPSKEIAFQKRSMPLLATTMAGNATSPPPPALPQFQQAQQPPRLLRRNSPPPLHALIEPPLPQPLLGRHNLLRRAKYFQQPQDGGNGEPVLRYHPPNVVPRHAQRFPDGDSVRPFMERAVGRVDLPTHCPDTSLELQNLLDSLFCLSRQFRWPTVNPGIPEPCLRADGVGELLPNRAGRVSRNCSSLTRAQTKIGGELPFPFV